MKSYEEIFKPTDPNAQHVNANTIPLDQLYLFKHHPFMLYNEEKMQEMVESIKQNGVIVLKFFPGDFTPQQIEEVILKLVEHWHRRRRQIAGG